MIKINKILTELITGPIYTTILNHVPDYNKIKDGWKIPQVPIALEHTTLLISKHFSLFEIILFPSLSLISEHNSRAHCYIPILRIAPGT